MSEEKRRATRRGVGSGRVSRALAPVFVVLGRLAFRLAVALGAVCALSGVGLAVLAALDGFWMIVAFECVVVLASVFALLAGLGRFRRGPGLALLSAGGAIALLAILSEPSLVTRFLGTRGDPLEIGGMSIFPVMLGRVVVGAALIGSSALVVWARSPARSVGYLIRSGLTGAGALVIVVLGVWRVSEGGARGGVIGVLDRVAGVLESLPLIAQLILVILGFFLVLGLVSASGHCAIRSFEAGRLEGPASENGAGGGGAAGGAPAPARA